MASSLPTPVRADNDRDHVVHIDLRQLRSSTKTSPRSMPIRDPLEQLLDATYKPFSQIFAVWQSHWPENTAGYEKKEDMITGATNTTTILSNPSPLLPSTSVKNQPSTSTQNMPKAKDERSAEDEEVSSSKQATEDTQAGGRKRKAGDKKMDAKRQKIKASETKDDDKQAIKDTQTGGRKRKAGEQSSLDRFVKRRL